MDSLVSLQILDLNNNNITEIKGLDSLVSLQELVLSFNMITEIPLTILNNTNLLDLRCDETILNSSGVKEFNLNEIIDDLILTEQTKESLIEYCSCDDIHSTLNVTFKEVLRK